MNKQGLKAHTAPPFDWRVHAQSLEKAVTELRRQVAELTLRVVQPAPVSLDIEGQPMIRIPDYLAATLIREYNAGRERFPDLPRYAAFDAYVIERRKDAVYGLNGLGIHGKGE